MSPVAGVNNNYTFFQNAVRAPARILGFIQKNMGAVFTIAFLAIAIFSVPGAFAAKQNRSNEFTASPSGVVNLQADSYGDLANYTQYYSPLELEEMKKTIESYDLLKAKYEETAKKIDSTIKETKDKASLKTLKKSAQTLKQAQTNTDKNQEKFKNFVKTNHEERQKKSSRKRSG